MNKRIQFILALVAVLATMMWLTSCDDDDAPGLTGDNVVYDLGPVSDQSISGTVTFAKRDDDKTVITIDLNGTTSGASHPAHIHADNAATSGAIILDLEAVDGDDGKSVTVVDELNDGTPITYEELIAFDGYVNVHLSDADLSTLVAQGDIGQNALTGDEEEYTLGSVSNPGISGTATFAKRQNNETLVTVQLTGTTAGGDHPSHIHANAAAQGGGIMIDLANVNGETGRAVTNVTELNSGTPITYDELINYNGYLNVHLSSTSLSTLIAQGDIGGNELTGTSKVYTLNPMSDPNISGTATFAKRKNGFTLVTVSLVGTTAGGNHPSHIHANSAAVGGPIVLDFTNINGTTGKSLTNVTQLKDGTPITYDQLMVYNGYVNVHLSPTSLATLIAQGNIGSNAP
jgi:carbon monoxide dehydrogenase subunit G